MSHTILVWPSSALAPTKVDKARSKSPLMQKGTALAILALMPFLILANLCIIIISSFRVIINSFRGFLSIGLYNSHVSIPAYSKRSTYLSNLLRSGFEIIVPIRVIGILDFIFKNMCKITSRRKNIKELLDPNNFKKEFFIENFKAVLSMKQEALTNGADFTVVILPVLIDLKSGTFNPVYNRIKTLFDENDIKYFDLTSAVAGYSDKYLWILPFDQHPNEIANEIFAQKLRDFFIKDYILGSDRIFQKSVVGQLE